MQLKWRLSHVRGYIELGMLDEAATELRQVPPEAAACDEVLAVQVSYYQETQDWMNMRQASAVLNERLPQDPSWWISLAYATRRAESLEHADQILRKAEVVHPKDATIQFNLGCYACQQGDLEEAKRRVRKAIRLDPRFLSGAKEDSDLRPLRAAEPTWLETIADG
ncbi:hypothetical protein DB347_00960 [Opitutaceae bacterium EW11]|nr:hypothetical protein DB347_00960 [Opitutaceae bacterium EW11]